MSFACCKCGYRNVEVGCTLLIFAFAVWAVQSRAPFEPSGSCHDWKSVCVGGVASGLVRLGHLVSLVRVLQVKPEGVEEREGMGKRIKLRIENSTDWDRMVLKSHSCTVEVTCPSEIFCRHALVFSRGDLPA